MKLAMLTLRKNRQMTKINYAKVKNNVPFVMSVSYEEIYPANIRGTSLSVMGFEAFNVAMITYKKY